MRQIIFFLTLITFFSCSEEKHPLLTDDDKALSLLLDLNIAAIAQGKYPTSIRDSISKVYKLQVCEMYDLKAAELDTTIWMMQNDFDRYNMLYKKLVDTLKRLENEFGSGNDKPLVPYDTMIDSLQTKNRKR